MPEKTTGKVKAHQIYKLADGTRVVGVTTVTGVINKPFLVPWANKLGLQGIDSTKYVDEKAAIGTLAHEMVVCYLTNTEPDLSDYTPNQIDLAENAVLKFYTWEENNDFELIYAEKSLVSEQYRYGGTIDLYGILNRRKTLLDLKTGKAIYSEHHTQVGGGYENLLKENGDEVEDVRILRIGRDDGEGFDDISVPNRDLHWQKFLACLEIYNIDKQLRRKS